MVNRLTTTRSDIFSIHVHVHVHVHVVVEDIQYLHVRTLNLAQ